MSGPEPLWRAYNLSTLKGNKEKWNANHEAILDFVYKCWDAGASIPEIIKKTGLKSRQTIYDHLRKAEGKEIIKEGKRYYDKGFIEKREKAEEAYNEIISFSKDDMTALTKGYRRFIIGQNPPAVLWLPSCKRVAETLAKQRRDIHKNKRLAGREGCVFADELLGGLKITIASNKGEFKLRDNSKITEISGPLPFPPKIMKAWDAEIYDSAVWMAFKLYEQLETIQKPFSRDSEIVIKVRLNPYEVTSGLFYRRYLDKRLWPVRHKLPVFPEFEKMTEYQIREKFLKEQDEQRKNEDFLDIVRALT